MTPARTTRAQRLSMPLARHVVRDLAIECEWTFAGSDAKRGASKWRCPAGQCKPGSVWVKASRLHPLIPRETDRFRQFYCQRGAVEREFGVLKHQWGLLPLRVRRIARVRLHVDLTILATLADQSAGGKAGGMSDPQTGPADYPVIHALDLERGAACMDCRRPFRPGDRYAERPIGFLGATPLTEVVCLACGYADSPV